MRTLKLGIRRGLGISVGGSSIVMIFVVLTLTVFATLSVVTASADLRFAKRSGRATTDYYSADSRAERILMQIDDELLAAKDIASRADKDSWDGNRQKTYFNQVTARLIEFEGIELDANFEEMTIRAGYDVPINDEKKLEVSLIVNDYNDDIRYILEYWRVVLMTDISSDEEHELWQPNK